MPEVVIPVGYANAVLTWNQTTRTQPITCTIGYDTDGSGISAALNAAAIFAAATSTGGSGNICSAASMTTAWQFTGVTVYERRSAGPLTRGDSVAAPVIGTLTSGANELTLNTTLRVTKRTGFVGRAYRGRMFAPFTRLEGLVSANGVIDASTLAVLRGQWTSFLTNMSTNLCDPVLLHSTAGVDPSPITSLFVQGVVGTQRRRLNR